MNNDWPILVVGLFSLGIVVLFIGIGMGEKKIKQEAVKANVAEWIANKDGNVEFRFKQ